MIPHPTFHPYTCFVDEDDLFDVMSEIMSLCGRYLSLGRALRLKAGDLDAIRRENLHDANQALNDVLLLWLRQKYNVQKFGLPSWRMLVQAVDNPAGGNNHALAKKIAAKYPLSECTCTRSCVYIRAGATDIYCCGHATF